jgi:hypothetical protein
MRVGVQLHTSAALPKEARYPLYRRLCGPHGRSGLVRKISPPTGFDPRTVQPVASRYTDYAIPAHILYILDKYQHFLLNGTTCFGTSAIFRDAIKD